MANEYSTDELLNFLEHTSERGLMPAATAQSLAVAARNIFGILTQEERSDVRQLDLDAVVKRFNNKRARDFNPASLKEYDRRVRRAVALFVEWRKDPASFAPKTRASPASRQRERNAKADATASNSPDVDAQQPTPDPTRGYQSSFPVRAGVVVTLSNVPSDLTMEEADRLAVFVKMLGVVRQSDNRSDDRHEVA